MDVRTNETVTAGPAPLRLASPANAVPIVAKMPVPMIAPTPRATRLTGPSVFLRPGPSPADCAMSASIDFVRKRAISRAPSIVEKRPEHADGPGDRHDVEHDEEHE